jgi:sec-independent protein translocase protein TatB
MFGMGIGEIVVIIVVALLFIGPEKLPEAAKSLSKGIRDIRKQTRELRETIEEDTEFGGAIRDLQSALRGEDIEAAANARRKLAAQKAAAKPGPASPLVTDSAAAGALAARIAAVEATPAAAETPAPTPATAGTDPTPSPAAPGMPVITASAGAVARGSTTTEPASSNDAENPAETRPAPEHAHG